MSRNSGRQRPASSRAKTERADPEDPAYLTRQLITCLGNKRALLGPICDAVEQVKDRLGKRRLRCFDVFCGSGVVSRLLKQHASLLVSNDLEDYAAVIARCFLANRGDVDTDALRTWVDDLNARVETAPLPPGFIEALYAPRDDANIQPEDRVFYTKANARRLDNYRRLIGEAPRALRNFLLGPLLSEASIHANTAGVFKGFYKDRGTGVGRFGGSGSDALPRILGPITLAPPVLSRYSCPVEVRQEDANHAVRTVADMDLAYIDPPYNQHPYGSNYFMLNLVARYHPPAAISRVSGIPRDWNRSGYNVRARSPGLLEDLLRHTDARFLLIACNDEGFVTPDQLRALVEPLGPVQVVKQRYHAFRGSRSFRNRPVHVTEHLFLVERT